MKGIPPPGSASAAGTGVSRGHRTLRKKTVGAPRVWVLMVSSEPGLWHRRQGSAEREERGLGKAGPHSAQKPRIPGLMRSSCRPDDADSPCWSRSLLSRDHSWKLLSLHANCWNELTVGTICQITATTLSGNDKTALQTKTITTAGVCKSKLRLAQAKSYNSSN